MKWPAELVRHKVDGNSIVHGDCHASLSHIEANGFFCDWKTEILRLLVDIVADVVLRSLGITRKRVTRFALDGVLKLVVREKYRDDLYPNEEHHP